MIITGIRGPAAEGLGWLSSTVSIAAILLASCGRAEDPEFHEAIRRGAEVMGRAVVGGDIETVANWTYPGLVEAMGGRDALLGAVEGVDDELGAAGMTVKDLQVTSVSEVVVAGRELHAVVEYELDMNVPEGVLRSTTALLAVSQDEGISWTYVDCGEVDKRMLRQLFPDFNDSLVLPKRTKSVLYRR